MNVALNLLLKAVGKYLESHPDQVEKLVEVLVDLAIAELKKVKQ